MQVKLQQLIINYFVFHLGLISITAHKKFLEPCQNQTIPKSKSGTNCTVFVAGNATKLQLQKLLLDEKVKTILLDIIIPKNLSYHFANISIKYQNQHTSFYKPFKWQVVRFDIGQNLLFLFRKFKFLNLTRINIGFRALNIDVRSEPPNCLPRFSDDFIYLIREMLLAFIEDSRVHSKKELSVCSQIIMKNYDIADFRTICYTHTLKHQITCNLLKSTKGWESLMIFRDIVVVITLLFGPFLIPRRFYSLTRRDYIFHLPRQLPITIDISESIENESNAQIYTFPIEQFPQLKRICPKKNVKYYGKLKALYLDVDDRKILPRRRAGVNFSRVLYNKLFRCKYRSDQMQTCLISRIFPFYCQCFRKVTWYICCRWFMNIVLLLLLPLPWLIRLFIYYKYEKEDIIYRDNFIKSLHLKISFRSSILSYIQPLHWVFILVYIVYFIDFITFGFFQYRKKQLTENIKKAFRCMRERANLEYITLHVECLFFPLKKFGLVGLIFVPFFWILTIPVLLVINSFYLVPLIHLVGCLLKDIAIYSSPCLLKKIGFINLKSLSLKENFLNFLVSLLFLLSIFSASILIMECINYLVTVTFFAFIILIIKVDITLPYISLGSLIIFYLFSTVNAVNTEYNNFKKKIIDKLIEEIVDMSNDNCDHLRPENTGYAMNCSLVDFTKRKNDLIFNSHSLLLFTDSSHRPYLPEKFFYYVCHLPYEGIPGSILLSYLKAFKKFLIILFFLSFIFILVRTFFELYKVSSTNQTLVTLVGGFIPLFLQKMINMNVKIHEVDMETIAFKKLFMNRAKEYSQDWVIKDFITDIKESEDLNASTNSSESTVLYAHLNIQKDIVETRMWYIWCNNFQNRYDKSLALFWDLNIMRFFRNREICKKTKIIMTAVL